MIFDAKTIKNQFMVYEAMRWVGMTEQGANKGQLVEMFQKAIDNKAQGEPWCMAFVGHCIKHADSLFKYTFGEKADDAPMKLSLSEHTLTTFNNAPKECIKYSAIPGSIVIWRFGDTWKGHAGIVTDVQGDYFFSIEGNTGPDDKTIVREGDGVYMRKRLHVRNVGEFRILGFLLPWS